MSENKKYKILLIQLPPPDFTIKIHRGNIPLAAGYLKSMAYKEGLLNKVNIEILGEKDTNQSNDSKLINLIISKSPDMLGFSLYVWNLIRSLFIAKEIKKKLPNIKIVVGGPEVTLEAKRILEDLTIDIGCFGEGEITFVEIIKNVLNGQNDHANIKGIFYRKQGKNTATPPREPIKDVNIIPSPYILGFINPKDYETAWLESARGCPFQCSYCAWSPRPVGSFSAERIYEELKIIRKSGVNAIRFLNGIVNASNFYKICEKIKKVNWDKKLFFSAWSYAEYINEKIADLLKECNFCSVEVGLQSVNLFTLESINRKSNLKKFITGISLLKERKINFEVDIIIGLPNETFEGFKQTLRFLKNNSCYKIVLCVLTLLPGSKLRKDAKKYGIKYQDIPPYLAIETPHFSKREIKKAINLSRPRENLATSFSGSLVSYCNIKYPMPQEKTINNFFKIKGLNNPIDKVILELDSSCQSISQLELLGKRLSGIVSQPFTAWFKTRNFEKDLVLIEAFLLPVATSNPFLLWSIILEIDGDFPVSIIERIKRNIPSKEKIFDLCQAHDAMQTCIVLPWRNAKENKLWLKNINKFGTFYRSFNIAEGKSWRKEATNLLREKSSAGILVDFNPKSKLNFIVEAIKFFREKNMAKKIVFRNLALDNLNLIKGIKKLKDISITSPMNIESILSLDRDMNVLSVLTPGNETTFNIIEFQIRFQKLWRAGQMHSIPIV